MTHKQLTLEDIAASFGVSVNELPAECKIIFSESNFYYKLLEGDERDRMIIRVLEEMKKDTQIIGAPERKQVWNKGWKENLNQFRANKDDTCAVIPRFYKPRSVIRWQQQFIIPEDPQFFEWNYTKILRLWFFEKYGKGYSDIYEFGCGTGVNLFVLADLFPSVNLFGSDFVPSSVSLVNEIAAYKNLNIEASIFDMLHPDYKYRIRDGSCVFTVGAVEQLAGKFHSFMDYLLSNNLRFCCHLEPVVELLDENNLIDYLAITFQNQRGYSAGLLPYLRNLHEKGIIELLDVRRLFFGNTHMEGYNIINWKPR